MADFNVNKRLKQLIEESYKVSPSEFSKKYFDNGAVKTYNILKERNGVSNKMLDIIINAYPEINRAWLLTGEGKRFKDKSNGIEDQQLELIKTSKMTEDEKFSVLMTLIEQHGDLIRQNGQLIEQNKMLIQHTMDLSETNSKQTSLLESIMKSQPSQNADGKSEYIDH